MSKQNSVRFEDDEYGAPRRISTRTSRRTHLEYELEDPSTNYAESINPNRIVEFDQDDGSGTKFYLIDGVTYSNKPNQRLPKSHQPEILSNRHNYVPSSSSFSSSRNLTSSTSFNALNGMNGPPPPPSTSRFPSIQHLPAPYMYNNNNNKNNNSNNNYSNNYENKGNNFSSFITDNKSTGGTYLTNGGSNQKFTQPTYPIEPYFYDYNPQQFDPPVPGTTPSTVRPASKVNLIASVDGVGDVPMMPVESRVGPDGTRYEKFVLNPGKKKTKVYVIDEPVRQNQHNDEYYATPALFKYEEQDSSRLFVSPIEPDSMASSSLEWLYANPSPRDARLNGRKLSARPNVLTPTKLRTSTNFIRAPQVPGDNPDVETFVIPTPPRPPPPILKPSKIYTPDRRPSNPMPPSPMPSPTPPPTPPPPQPQPQPQTRYIHVPPPSPPPKPRYIHVPAPSPPPPPPPAPARPIVIKEKPNDQPKKMAEIYPRRRRRIIREKVEPELPRDKPTQNKPVIHFGSVVYK